MDNSWRAGDGDKTGRQRMKTRTRKLRIGNSVEIRLFSVYLVSEVHSCAANIVRFSSQLFETWAGGGYKGERRRGHGRLNWVKGPEEDSDKYMLRRVKILKLGRNGGESHKKFSKFVKKMR